MADTSAHNRELNQAEQQRLEEMVLRFDRTWQAGQLAAFIEPLPASSPLRRAALIELVKIDLEKRWTIGGRQVIEFYLQHHPELGSQDNVPVSLLLAEVRVRTQFGASMDLTAFGTRFPGQVEELRRLMDEEQSFKQETVAPQPSTGPWVKKAGSVELSGTFGRYRIIKELGGGGMGKVYLAEDTELKRQVALKVPLIGDDPQVLERFRTEAQAAAKLDHPNICKVFDVGTINGVHYMTMQYIEGRPLSALVKEGKALPIRGVVVLVRRVALALAEAHRHGVVHRDLKPANIMMNQRNEPMVMDFGLACLADREAGRVTKDGSVLGTPAYMAPEQARGEVQAIGPHTDVYSLGVTLYELLTGKLPFEGPLLAILNQIQTIEPELASKHRSDVDPALEAICLKAMAKKPEYRYASMAQLASVLGEYLRNSTQPGSQPTAQSDSPTPAADATNKVSPPEITLANPVDVTGPTTLEGKEKQQRTKKQRRRFTPGLTWAAAGILVAGTLVWVVLLMEPGGDPAGQDLLNREYDQGDSNTSELTKPTPRPVKVNLEGLQEKERFPWQPEELVAVLGEHKGRCWSEIKSLASSPDGKTIATGSWDRHIQLWDSETLSLRGTLDPGHYPAGTIALAYTWDGNKLISATQPYNKGRIRVFDLQQQSAYFDITGENSGGGVIAVSPSGQFLAVSGAENQINIWDLNARMFKTTLRGHNHFVTALAFSPNSQILASYTEYSNKSLEVKLWDVNTWKESPFLLLDTENEGGPLAFARDGSYLAAGGYFFSMDKKRENLSKTGKKPYFKFGSFGRSCSFSPTEDKVAYVVSQGKICLLNIGDKTTRYLPGVLPSCVYDSPTAFSTDGASLTVAGMNTVMLVDLALEKLKVPLRGHVGKIRTMHISDDGTQLITAGRDESVRIWNVTTGKDIGAFQNTGSAITAMTFVQEGSKLLLVDASSRVTEWITHQVPPSPLQTATRGAGLAAISRDGKWIAWTSRDKQPPTIVIRDRLGKVKERQTTLEFNAQVGSLSFSPSGNLLAVGLHNLKGDTFTDGQVQLLSVQDRPGFPKGIKGHKTSVDVVAFSYNEKVLATGDGWGEVKLWNLKTGTEITAFNDNMQVNALAFSPNDHLLAVADNQGCVVLSQITPKKQLRKWNLPGSVCCVAFFPDGRHLALGNGNGTVYIIRLPPLAEINRS